MALTGQLSDLSLAELIEFFCNQRKTGRLKVDYPRAPGVFFMEEGELVDAKLGLLEGEEAVYFALTLPNAAFDFNTNIVPTQRTINDAWTHVVLEGLRRFDEGITPGDPYADDLDLSYAYDPEAEAAAEAAARAAAIKKRYRIAGAVAAVVVCIVGVVAVPKIVKNPPQIIREVITVEKEVVREVEKQKPTPIPLTPEQIAEKERIRKEREQRDRERAERERQERDRLAANRPQPTPAPRPVATPEPAGTKAQIVSVRVEYDETGRVTSASLAGPAPGGAGSTALTIARRKRFRPGSPGSTVVSIPIGG
jgi:hypothetical protein